MFFIGFFMVSWSNARRYKPLAFLFGHSLEKNANNLNHLGGARGIAMVEATTMAKWVSDIKQKRPMDTQDTSNGLYTIQIYM